MPAASTYFGQDVLSCDEYAGQSLSSLSVCGIVLARVPAGQYTTLTLAPSGSSASKLRVLLGGPWALVAANVISVGDRITLGGAGVLGHEKEAAWELRVGCGSGSGGGGGAGGASPPRPTPRSACTCPWRRCAARWAALRPG